jgi:Spy/CpxP family protein refolding chaperone
MNRDWMRPGRARLLAVLLLLGVFTAGALSGAAADRLLEAREVDPTVAPGGPGRQSPGPRIGDRMQFRRSPVMMLEQRLNLTEQQVEQVESIFEARRVRTEAILREFQPRLQAQRDSTDLEIRAVLTSEQAEAFDDIIREGRGGGRDFRAGPGDRRRGQ